MVEQMLKPPFWMVKCHWFTNFVAELPMSTSKSRTLATWSAWPRRSSLSRIWRSQMPGLGFGHPLGEVETPLSENLVTCTFLNMLKDLLKDMIYIYKYKYKYKYIYIYFYKYIRFLSIFELSWMVYYVVVWWGISVGTISYWVYIWRALGRGGLTHRMAMYW